MYGIFTYISHKNQPNVGKYTSPMDPQGISSKESFRDISKFFLLNSILRLGKSLEILPALLKGMEQIYGCFQK